MCVCAFDGFLLWFRIAYTYPATASLCNLHGKTAPWAPIDRSTLADLDSSLLAILRGAINMHVRKTCCRLGVAELGGALLRCWAGRHTRTRNASLPTQAKHTTRGARKQTPNQGAIHAASKDTTHTHHTTPCALLQLSLIHISEPTRPY